MTDNNLYIAPTYSVRSKEINTSNNNYKYNEVSSVRPKVNIPPRLIEEFTNAPSYATYKPSVNYTPRIKAIPSKNFTYTKHEVTESKISIDNNILELTSKFNAIMYYYNSLILLTIILYKIGTTTIPSFYTGPTLRVSIQYSQYEILSTFFK